MVRQNKTPAPRRFLPPSSASRLQHNASSSQRTSFARPSHPSSSSPFTKTPFSNDLRCNENIQTSFDEQIDFIIPNTTPNTSPKVPHGHVDYIEDGDDRDRASHEDLAPGSYSTTAPCTRKDDFGLCHGNVTSSPRADFSSPLPKRQKVSHPKKISAKPIDISSSSSESNDETLESSELNAGAVQRSKDSEFEAMEQDAVKDIVGEHLARKRFRIRPPMKDARMHEVEPASARSAFKDIHGTKSHWSETPLPITFSPSKRKGKYDYVYGGAAEMVRNWILDLASEQSRATESSTHTLRINRSFSDASGRFDIVNDEEGRNWMLVHQEAQREPLRDSANESQGKRKSISIKNRSTTWSVGVSGNTEAQPDQLHVAVLWEPAR